MSEAKNFTMKHNLKITIILISLFLLAQIIGLATINKYLKVTKTQEGLTIIKHENTVLGEQPDLKETDKKYSALPITIAVLIGTALVFLLMRFKLGYFWKLWYLLSVWITLAISFDIYMVRLFAIVLALLLALLKTFKPNIYIHNLTEVFIYTGITIIILPFLNLVSGFMLLLFISIYDMYAVWKSKHMIKLAKFQAKSKMFAGLLLSYPSKEKISLSKKKAGASRIKTAILGGGDIAFPLMFSSAVMEHLIKSGLTKQLAFIQSSLISVFVTIALSILLIKSEKGKFYPAMPFLSLGCVVGYLVVWAVNLYL